jgi:hypothetical protein
VGRGDAVMGVVQYSLPIVYQSPRSLRTNILSFSKDAAKLGCPSPTASAPEGHSAGVFEFCSGLVDLVVCVGRHLGGGHRRTLAGERFVRLIAEDVAEMGDRRGVAGRADTLFSEDAIALIHNASRGHPSAINNLALHALTAAFAADHASSTRKPPASPSPKSQSRRGPHHHAHHGPAHHTKQGRPHASIVVTYR